MIHIDNNLNFLLIGFLFGLIYFINHSRINNIIKIYDKPNHRKRHLNSVAITGGLGLMILIILSFCLFSFIEIQNVFFISKEKYFEIIIFSFLIFFIGIIDDKYELDPKTKLLFSFLVYLVFLNINPQFLVKEISFSWTNHTINLGSFSFLFTVLCFVIYLQITNMFDGANLQCSLYSITLFLIFYSILKNTFFLILVAYLIIFSYWNLKNKSFLGDGGNYLISFFVSISLIYMHNNTLINADHVVFLILIPTLDLVRLFFLRIKSKKSPFNSDRNHIHHYLIKKYNFKKIILGYIFFLFMLSLIIIFKNLYLFPFVLFLFFMIYVFLLILCKDKSR